MGAPREIRFFPELAELPEHEQRERLQRAKASAFGPDQRLERWRGNVINFLLMFGLSAAFMVWLVPMLELSRDTAAVFMLLAVLPGFFILQQKRYIRLIRRELARQ